MTEMYIHTWRNGMLIYFNIHIHIFTDINVHFIQQVDDKYIRTIHLHASSGSNGSTGKNSHRSKTLTNNQSRDRHDALSRVRSLVSQSSAHGKYIIHTWKNSRFYFFFVVLVINSLKWNYLALTSKVSRPF